MSNEKVYYCELEVNVFVGEDCEGYRKYIVATNLPEGPTEDKIEKMMDILSDDYDLGYCKVYGTTPLKRKPKKDIDFDLT